MNDRGRNIIIKFASDEAARHFASWLCNRGEQEYWDWMRCREEEEPGDITAVSFNYWGVKDEPSMTCEHGHTVEHDQHGTPVCEQCPSDPVNVVTNPSSYGEFMCDWTIRTTPGRLDR